MVCTRGDVEHDVVAAERWSDDSDVGQMGTAKHGVVRNQDIALLQLATPELSLFLDASRHTAQMDW